ncbi:hypothetical protein KL919_000447 [Ogataea angusta]|nr:hypothetical protein KL920_000733 [Ogataea angusta]KAG7864419.1 hypothetical protein KL919_000447 [Ogataea angusta]
MSFKESSYSSQNDHAPVKLPPISFLSSKLGASDKEGVAKSRPESQQLPSLSSINSGEFQLPSISSLASGVDSAKLASIVPSKSPEQPLDQKLPPLKSSASPPSTNNSSPSRQQINSVSPPREGEKGDKCRHHKHVHDELTTHLKEAQQHLKNGGHIHIVHQPHGNHHHHKVLVHNPNETPSDVPPPQGNDTTIIQNDSTIIDPNATVPQDQSLVHQASPKQSTEKTKETFRPREITIDSKETLLLAAKFPRKHLGSIIYQAYPTKETRCMYLQNIEPEHMHEDSQVTNELASKRIELLPAYFANYINCTVDIHIPYQCIPDNVNVYDRRLWGTDIYTDDSDIVAILYHCGVLKSADPSAPDSGLCIRTPEDSEKSGESIIDNEKGTIKFSRHTGPLTPGNLENRSNVIKQAVDSSDANDLVVTLLILPRLGVYQGTYRNNYYSRTWGSNGRLHNGVSIALYAVKWCKLGGSYDGLNYGSFRKRLLSERIELSQKLLKTSSEQGAVPGWDLDRKYYKEFK